MAQVSSLPPMTSVFREPSQLYPIDKNIGLSSDFALLNASSLHEYQSTGL